MKPQPNMFIRGFEPGDAAAVANIYDHYVRESIITFEEEPVSAAEIARRSEEVKSAGLPWLVAHEETEILGYAYATRWRSRAAYRFSVEITAYAAPHHIRRGIGSKLYSQLIPLLQARHVHAAIAGIALPNEASVALHEKFDFRKVGHFTEVGYKFRRWIDVGYWQRNLS